jgi:hypothetical protein
VRSKRTQEEIVARLESCKDDLFPFESSEYLRALNFEHAQPYLKDSVTATEWDRPEGPATPEEAMRNYMEFAWEKANDKRGLSAMRAMHRCAAWVWLIGDEKLIKRFEDAPDCYYGKPSLEVICDHFGWDWQQWDNGERTNA